MKMNIKSILYDFLLNHSEKMRRKHINEIAYSHFREKFMDPSFPWKNYVKKESDYFAKWGFHVSQMESEYFSRCSGVVSDLYVPFSIWKFFIYSYLNKDVWRFAYSDKNMFRRLLDLNSLNLEVKLPHSVIYNIAGQFYDGSHKPCTIQRSIDILMDFNGDVLVKPTVESHGGSGIIRLPFDGKSKSSILGLFEKYGEDFVVQEIIKQHPDLASFNSESVNTIRVATYRKPCGEVKVLYAIQRFGSGSNICDNASSGGCYCGIREDGTYIRNVHKHRRIETTKLREEVALKVPRYDDIKNVVCDLHNQLPQFSIIGWDFTVSDKNEIYLIEYNFSLGYNLPQSSLGPLFSKEDLEELLGIVSKARVSRKLINYVSHPSKKGYDFSY